VQSFASFVLDGLAWPAAMIAMGSGMVLFARPTPYLTQEQLEAAHPLVRYFAKRASKSSEIRAGWSMIAVGVLIAVLRIVC
jgi:hypothetical protein